MGNDLTIEKLWELSGFKPNDNQREAILYVDGPLFLTAGPGSGKTRVLLWRTLNLIVFHGVKPEEIYLSTFTEKAAKQLQDGLRSLLGMVTNITNQPYDISKMAVGTVHSNCRMILGDRRFSEGHARIHPPSIMDELSQYFKIHSHRFWRDLCTKGGFASDEEANKAINAYFGGMHRDSGSRHWAVTNIIGIFNRFSEECLEPDEVETHEEVLSKMLLMYKVYLDELNSGKVKLADLSLLQKFAFQQLCSCKESGKVFKHIIIDEYQDTNAIQEKIFFKLAEGNKNICVVGDDDQALYRFRGATVENLVEFETKCEAELGVNPRRIDLDINYRSREKIVEAYTEFIDIPNWARDPPLKGFHRVHDKNIVPDSKDEGTSVVVSRHGFKDEVFKEVARFVYDLKQSGKIDDYSQCAFLFPAMKNNRKVEGYMGAFFDLNEELGLTGTDDEIKIYAPRAGTFLEQMEAMAVWGLMLNIFDRPHYGNTQAPDLQGFRQWMINSMTFANHLCDEDPMLKQFIEDRKREVERVKADYSLFHDYVSKNGLDLKGDFTVGLINDFAGIVGLSEQGKKNLKSKFFVEMVKRKVAEGRPYKIEYVINRSSSLDWSILDLFYRLNGFDYFREMYDLAQRGVDEGPICNLGLITQYLSRFMEEYTTIITGAFLKDEKFNHALFSSYTYAIYRRGESEYEDLDDPFPKGRISFMTIHQSKGLEFPVVVLGSIDKRVYPNVTERVVRELLSKDGEPLDRIGLFDNMRMFYVALSRAQNLLVLPRLSTTSKKAPRPDQIVALEEFKTMLLRKNWPTIADFDFETLPAVKFNEQELGKSYSYTGDYISYLQCPRQYMIFRKYGFVPSRSQTMMYGSLIHQTIEDLHQMLIDERARGGGK
jgi:DNA helicase-2/ATP-dependent DNA helicase PcrA